MGGVRQVASLARRPDLGNPPLDPSLKGNRRMQDNVVAAVEFIERIHDGDTLICSLFGMYVDGIPLAHGRMVSGSWSQSFPPSAESPFGRLSGSSEKMRRMNPKPLVTCVP
jgi:hypothetical protein